jgi:hypothetical protein
LKSQGHVKTYHIDAAIGELDDLSKGIIKEYMFLDHLWITASSSYFPIYFSLMARLLATAEMSCPGSKNIYDRAARSKMSVL